MSFQTTEDYYKEINTMIDGGWKYYKRDFNKGARKPQSDICIVEGCGKKSYARSWCLSHYNSWRRNGSTEYKRKLQPPICIVKDCRRKTRAKGLCIKHYGRMKRYGTTDDPPPYKGERVWSWKGGIFDYPNHRTLQKNRLIKFEQVGGHCEICNKKATKAHHKDGSKDNHVVENLLAVCNKCHGLLHTGRTCKTSKWIRRYGMNIKSLCKKLNCSYTTLIKWHRKGHINYFLAQQNSA